MARTPESAAVDFAESSLFTGRFSILALAACGVGFGLSGRLPAAIFSLAAAAVAAAARLWARHVLDGVNAALQAERSCVFPGEPCPLRVTLDNPKWLPLVWLTVRFPLEPGGALRPEHRWETVELPEGGVQKPYYEKNVSFLLGHQRMSYTSRLQAEHRGLLSFDRIPAALRRWPVPLRPGEGNPAAQARDAGGVSPAGSRVHPLVPAQQLGAGDRRPGLSG